MRKVLGLVGTLLLVSLPAVADEPPLADPLLDRMVGTWVLRGTIAGAETTHDVVVEWVLNHQYVRLHETSREKAPGGRAAYEAIVFLGVDKASDRYACLWLDSTGGGGLSAQAIAHAKRGGDEIALEFRGADGSVFHTTFAYDRAAGVWRWLMDGEEAGALKPFARVRLTKR
jgi:hypothetical protein